MSTEPVQPLFHTKAKINSCWLSMGRPI